MNQDRGILVMAAVLLAASLAACGGGSAPPGDGGPVSISTASASPTTSAQVRVDATLVAGFPADLVPVPPGASVTSSAVEPTGDVRRISLTGTSTASAKKILAFYHGTLTKAGFTVARGSVLPSGVTGTAFSRHGDQELLLLAVTDTGGRRSFSIGGTVRA